MAYPNKKLVNTIYFNFIINLMQVCAFSAFSVYMLSKLLM